MHNRASIKHRLLRVCAAALVATLAPAAAIAQSLPSGWATANIGNASPTGAATFANGDFTVNAGGAGITSTADQFRLVYRQLSGDGTIVAKVSQMGGPGVKGRAGVVIRESLSPGARTAAVLVDADGDGTNLMYRSSTGGKVYYAARRSNTRVPVWLKLTRAGNVLTATQSADGTTWVALGTVTVPMTSTIYAGLAVASRWPQVDTMAVFSGVNGVSATNPTPNVAPTVSLAAPAGPFTAPASIALTATAADSDGTVARVDFYQGTSLVGSDSSSPYAFTWANAAAGTYSFKAVAIDDKGASGTSASVSATVSSVNKPPTVSLAAPAGPFTAPASITLAASAADADGTIARVDFYQGTSLLGSDSSSPYSFIWANAPAGAYTLKAVAIDNQGASGTSASVQALVSSPNQAPTVSLTTPAGPFTAPASITLNAAAADADGTVARVDFYQGASLIGSDSSSPFSFTWASAPAGTYSFKAVAVDNQGATGTSAAVGATVSSPNQAPTVSLATPAGPFTAPATVTLNATAADADGTVARVDFYQGTALIGSDSSSPFSFTWASVAAGSYSLKAVAVDNQGATGTSAAVAVTVSAPPSTNKPPTISLGLPGGPFTAPTTILMYATATDSDGTVARVDFYRGGTLVGTDSVSPFSYSFANAPAGTYVFTAIAVDNLGATTVTDPRTVVIGGSTTSTTSSTTNQPPTVSLTAPANGSSVLGPANVTVSATATDSDGTVARVDFYQGTSLIGSDTSSPYSVTWSSVPTGSYTFKAVAVDNAGASTTSASVTAAVTSNQAPIVSLTSPVSGSSFAGPASVAMTATASDPDGTIARVDFYSGTTKIGSSSGSPYSFAWTGVAVGTYTLTAVAFDNSGLSTVSSTVQMQVTDPNLPHNAVWTPSSNDATAVSTYIIELFPNGVNTTTANPVATHDAGKPAQVNGEYVADISGVISGLPSGTYVATVTAVGTSGAAQSAPSAAFTK